MLDMIGALAVRKFCEHPIVVVGASRSGTSILLQALGAHPKIYAMPGETPFLTTVGGTAHLFEDGANRDYYLDSIKVPKDYLYRHLKKLGFEVAAGPHMGWHRMLKGLLGRGESPLGKSRWAAKSFPSEPVTQGLLHLYPTIRFIYIRRNGLDVVQSRTRFHGFNKNDFETQCVEWAKSVEKYAHLNRFDQAVSVRQEDLLNQPEAFFQEVLKFLALPPHPGPADYANSTLVHPLDQNTEHSVSAKQTLAARPPAYADWTGEQKDLFKAICSSAMEQAGYEIPF